MKNIEEALIVLEKNIVNINTVAEWAQLMEYSSSGYFSRSIRTSFRKPPSKLIQKAKLDLIASLFIKHPNEIYFFIAIESGFANGQSLAKFVKRATGKTLTEFKTEYENGVRKRSTKAIEFHFYYNKFSAVNIT